MYIKVKVTADAKDELFRQVANDSFEVSVKEKAERNLANKRVCEIVARQFNVSSNKVHIISGHRSRGKILNVENEKRG